MSDDEQSWALILGGIFGAILTAPKPQDKEDLEQYKIIKQQLNLRTQRLGTLPKIEILRTRPHYYNIFIEAYNMHVYGFFRGASILAASIIESILKDEFDKKNFKELIDEAKEKKMITMGEFHYLHGLRHDRNKIVHDVFNEVKEEDSFLVMNIMIKLLKNVKFLR